MFSPKNIQPIDQSKGKYVKLPQIASRNKMKSAKIIKNTEECLPSLKSVNSKRHIKGKQNDNGNVFERNSLEKNIEARKEEVQMVDKRVKDILGCAQDTVNLGGDLTNFQYKIELNRELIKRYKQKGPFRTDISVNEESANEQLKSEGLSVKKETNLKGNIVTEQNQPNRVKLTDKKEKKGKEDYLQIEQKAGHLLRKLQEDKVIFKSERKLSEKQSARMEQQERPKVFKSIKEILEPQKKSEFEEGIVNKKAQFSIEELEHKLRKLDAVDTSDKKSLSSVKSVGNIPSVSPQYATRQWKVLELETNNQIQDVSSNYEKEIDSLLRLEQKSHKSISKMMENRLLLVDLHNIRVTSHKKVPLLPLDQSRPKQ